MVKDKGRFPVSLTKCFLCGEDNEIIIGRRMTYLPEGESEVEKMHGKAIHTNPCNKCKKYMEQGIIIITVDIEKSSGNKPEDMWRTGGWFVIKDSAVMQMAEGLDDKGKEIFSQALDKRVLFMSHEMAEQFGLFEIIKEKNNKEESNND